MLVVPGEWELSQTCEQVIAALPPELAHRTTAETHGSALELATGVHTSIGSAVDELASLRAALASELHEQGLAVASAGTHPFAIWSDVVGSPGER